MTTPRRSIPTGIVTVLFTDVEGSTRLWAANVETTSRSFVVHDSIIREAIEQQGGYVFGWAGDSFRGAFDSPTAATAAAIEAQDALADADWGPGPALKVRMGIHRGRVTEREGDYFGPVPNTAARVEGLANGGQTLITDEVRVAIDIETLWLGEHRLRDVPQPIAIHQVGTEPHRPLRAVDPNLSTLPNPGTPIIGRQRELDQIRGLLETASLITLTGIGGCGKTRLAVEVAYQELPNRPGGCYFADLSAVADGAELPAALASAIRLTLSGGDAIGQVVEHLAARKALLILDNCEHIVEECARFAELLLARSSNTALLTTTRQRLEVPGEQIVAVPSLDNEDRGPAVELFIERAIAANPSFEVDEEVRPLLSEICTNLDGMPLAIELAAARVAILSPTEILERMEDRFRLLSGGRGRHRRRTLQATLDWSYDLLDQDEQNFFMRCGTFVGSFDLNAAVAVAGDDFYEAMDLVGSLVNKSLVACEEDDGQTRFRLLETVRIYAAEQLARANMVGETRDAHLSYYHQLVASDSWGESADLDRSHHLHFEWANIASALEWATATDDWERASAMALGCQGMWESQIAATEGRRWLELIVPNVPADRVERGEWLHFNWGSLSIQLDDFERVHELFSELLTARSPGPQTQAMALHAFTRVRQHPDKALELLAQADEVIARHQLGAEALCPSLWVRGNIALYDADYGSANESFRAAYAAARSEDYRIAHLIICGLSYASTQILIGEPKAALETLDAEDWSNSVWDSSPIVRALALVELDQVNEAADLVIEYGRLALLGRLSRMSNDALVGLAALAIKRQEPDHAWSLLREAVSPRSPFTIGLAESLADRLGRGEELRHMHRDRLVPLATLDASDALVAELERLPGDR